MKINTRRVFYSDRDGTLCEVVGLAWAGSPVSLHLKCERPDGSRLLVRMNDGKRDGGTMARLFAGGPDSVEDVAVSL